VLLSFLNKPFNPFNGLRVGRKPANDRLASSKLFSYSNAPIVPLADSLFVKICTVDLFDSVHMNALANSSRRRLGQILGSTRGQELVQTAEDWMREHGVADPEKMTCFHAGPL